VEMGGYDGLILVCEVELLYSVQERALLGDGI
jgi:hypothetical protein